MSFSSFSKYFLLFSFLFSPVVSFSAGLPLPVPVKEVREWFGGKVIKLAICIKPPGIAIKMIPQAPKDLVGPPEPKTFLWLVPKSVLGTRLCGPPVKVGQSIIVLTGPRVACASYSFDDIVGNLVLMLGSNPPSSVK